MSDPIVSHGRGGAGNIEPDSTPYVDGEIVRAGPQGDQGDGAYSTGRGGAANINSPSIKPATHPTGDADVIPEAAVVHHPGEEHEKFHTGRGGEGNAHREGEEGKVHEGLADKLKHKMFGRKEG